MPLDPQIRSMLDALKAATEPSEQQTLEQSRATYCREYLDMSRGPDGHVDEQVVALPGLSPDITLTRYRPTGTGPLPLILYLHGGGFVLGDTRAYGPQSARIAECCDAIVAFLDYRRAPENPFPAALDDTVSTLRILAANAAKLGADPDRIALMGDSAGGNLAIGAMFELRDEILLKAVTLLYPVTDFRPYVGQGAYSQSDEAHRTGYYLDRADMEFFARSYLGQDPGLAGDPRVSPLARTDIGHLPPVLLYGSEYDLLRDQGRAFADRLQAAGANIGYRCFDGLIHNFMQQAGISEASDQAFGIVCAETRAALA